MPATRGPNEKFCHACGHIILKEAELCPHCGVRQTGAWMAPNGKNKIVTALLALFLGGFGIHRFYLGHIALGFLYLVFCWTLIPGLIAFIEFFYFLLISDEDFSIKYGQLSS